MRKLGVGAAIAALSLMVSGTAVAAPATKSAPKSPAPAKKSSPPNFEAMLGFVDKLFPPQPEPDPARLALARTSVAAMWPDGAYGRMMTGMMGGMFDRFMQMKQSDFAAMGGKAPKGVTPSGDLSLHEQAAAKDPYFDQRVAAMRAVFTEELGKISAIIDPRIRDGLARTMARRFDAQQLNDINRFYATPSGHALASQSMQMWVDPDMMRSIFASVPEMMKLMPEIMQKVQAANEKFPKPPKAASPEAKPTKH
jgi:hypothetical protein